MTATMSMKFQLCLRTLSPLPMLDNQIEYYAPMTFGLHSIDHEIGHTSNHVTMQ